MRTPRPHTAREEARAEIRQRPDAGTGPAPETSAAGAATMRVVGGAAIALAASLVIENTVVVAGSPSYWSPIKGVLAYHEEPLVSVDFNGSPASSTVDMGAVKVLEDKLARVASWYDNEWGFSCRMLDTAAAMAALG